MVLIIRSDFPPESLWGIFHPTGKHCYRKCLVRPLICTLEKHLRDVLIFRTMLHDENEFGSNTGEFRPERFFDPSVADPLNVVFGFGRRCVYSNTVDFIVHIYPL